MATQEPSLKVRNINVVAKRITIFERRLSKHDSEIYASRLAGKWQCVIIRVTPERIVSVDYSKA